VLKKTFLGVLFAVLILALLIAGINFNVTKAVDYGSSGTTVGGYISEDTTWTLDGSPYIVIDDVVAESDVTLTVEPGVIVKFTSGTNLIIDGALVARGNSTYPITFTSNSTTPTPGDWGSIHFRDSSDDASCVINYGVVRFGTTGILAVSSSPQIRYCNVSDNGENGVDIREGSPSIYRCFVANNNIGIHIGGADAAPTIIENEIRENGLDGIFCDWAWGWAGPTSIERNEILSNGRNGITCDVSHNVLISDNVIVNNTGSGIFSNRLDMRVRGNVIKNNDYGIYVVYGVGAQGAVYPINYNHMIENSAYDFYNSRSTDLDATNNWWGTTNETKIKEHIYDYYDDYNLGKVFYKPYLVPPVANFTYSPAIPYAYGTVTFNASASFNPYGSIINHTWNFDDGNITTTASPVITHTYILSGNYNVTLTVMDEFGLVNSTTTTIVVLQDDVPPVITDDYDGAWHNADFVITLTATDHESGVKESYYRINNESIQAVSTRGQPLITAESANNTLEYWSVDNAGNEELPHKMLTEIKLDKTAPTIGIPFHTPEEEAQPDQEVKVSVNVTDSMGGVKSVRLKYTSNRSVLWLDFPMTFNSTTGLWEFVIPGQQANTLVKYRIEAYDNALNHKVDDNSGQYYVYTVIPEFTLSGTLLLFVVATLIVVIVYKRKHQTRNKKREV